MSSRSALLQRVIDSMSHIDINVPISMYEIQLWKEELELLQAQIEDGVFEGKPSDKTWLNYCLPQYVKALAEVADPNDSVRDYVMELPNERSLTKASLFLRSVQKPPERFIATGDGGVGLIWFSKDIEIEFDNTGMCHLHVKGEDVVSTLFLPTLNIELRLRSNILRH